MNFPKIAEILELSHYRRVFVFILRHPLKFIKRLSMFVKVSIAWTVVSTIFGFVLFGLVARDLIIEKGKNTELRQESAQVQEELNDVKNSQVYKMNLALDRDFQQSQKILKDSIAVYENITALPDTHKKLPDFKKRLLGVLSFLENKKNDLALQELQKLSAEVDAERRAQVQ